MSTGSYRFTSLKNRELFGQANHLVMCSWDFFVFFAFFRTQDCRPHGKTRWQGCHEGFFEASSEKARGRIDSNQPSWTSMDFLEKIGSCCQTQQIRAEGAAWKCFQNVLNQMRNLRNLSPTWKCSSHLLHTSLYSIFSDAWDEQSIYPCLMQTFVKGHIMSSRGDTKEGLSNVTQQLFGSVDR